MLGAFRREMWPVLGMTTLEAAWVLDQLLADGAPEPVVAGGLSMGGDVAVALAGVDPRVRRVAAVGSTPDWTRPGMRKLLDPGTVADQHVSSEAARRFAAGLPDQAVEVSVLDGLDHGTLFGDAGVFDRTIAWLTAAG